MTTRVVGIFGGTFDPFHLAHLRMAEAYQQEARLTELRVIPAGTPYHRKTVVASAEDRRAMVELGIANMAGMVVDDRELQRDSASFTVDTLSEIRAEIGPEIPLWFLIGGDSLLQLDTWHRWRSLFSLAHLAVAMRPGTETMTLPPLVEAEWRARFRPQAQNRAASGTILRLTLAPLDLSASAVRNAVGNQQPITHLVPPAVASYIFNHGLYQLGTLT